MFNFKIKENNHNSFKLKENNISNFIIKKNNIYDFILKALEATITKNISFNEKYSSIVTIGGRKTLLKEFSQTPLKDLPSSLKEFIGSYVYIKAKMRLNQLSISTASMVYKLVMKLKINSEYHSKIIVNKSLLKAKTKFNTINFSLKINVNDILIAKLKLANLYSMKTSDIRHRLILKTKPTIIYSLNTTMNMINPIIAKLKFFTVERNDAKIKFLAKLKGKLTSKYFCKPIMRVKTKAKATINSVMLNRASIGNLPLELYRYDKLVDLPKMLKDLIGTNVRLLAKTRFLEKNSFMAQSRIGRYILKLKLSDINKNDCEIQSTNLYECIQLTHYENTQLADTPSSLFSFCYINPLGSWSGVNKTYSTWEEVSKLSTWRDLTVEQQK